MDNKRKFNFTDEKGLKDSFNNMMKNLEDNANFQTLLDDFIKKLEKEIEKNIQHKEEEEENLKEQLLQSQEKINKGIQENINAIKLELSFYDTNKSKVIKQIEDIQDFKNFIEFSSYNDLKNLKEELKDLKLILDEQEELYKTLLIKHKDIKILSEKLLKSKESELEISKKFTEYINNLDL